MQKFRGFFKPRNFLPAKISVIKVVTKGEKNGKCPHVIQFKFKINQPNDESMEKQPQNE